MGRLSGSWNVADALLKLFHLFCVRCFRCSIDVSKQDRKLRIISSENAVAFNLYELPTQIPFMTHSNDLVHTTSIQKESAQAKKNTLNPSCRSSRTQAAEFQSREMTGSQGNGEDFWGSAGSIFKILPALSAALI